MYSLSDFTNNLRGNLFGGVTAGIVALPLALAFGISSGAGPVAGLYGAIIVGLFASVFGGTPAQISGPTGPMTVVMTAMIAECLAFSPESGLVYAFTTVFLGGCIQLLFGLLRLGKYVVMVPYPVISGFMTGIGVIIILLEIGPFLGFPASGNIVEALASLPTQLASANHEAFITGSLTLAVVFLWRGKAGKVIPSPLLALVVASIALGLLFPESRIERIGDIPTALPALHIPAFDAAILKLMVVNALMLAVLGSIDSLLTSLVADNVTGTQHDSDRELIGQGIGNAVAGLFGGLPGAGATMRTVVNIRSGGDGPLSGVTHALVLTAILAGAASLFESIPLAALAGILMKVGIDIIDWPFIKRIHRLPAFPVALMLLVLVLTVTVDLITAVFVGVFIKNLVTINKLSDLELGNVILSDGTEETDRLSSAERDYLNRFNGNAVLLKITGPMSYAVGRGLKAQYENFKHRNLLLIDVSIATIIGISTVMVIEELIKKAQVHGTEVKLIGVHNASASELKQLGLLNLVGEENCLDSLEQAA